MHPFLFRLLLLEDNEDDARLVQVALEDYAPGEFAVIWVERLADALAQIRTEHFDAMLSDLGLPDSGGLPTVQEIVAHAPALPLVVLTGGSDEDLGRQAIRYGASDYLLKGETGGRIIARALRFAIESKRLENRLRAANEELDRRVTERTLELEIANNSLRESEAQYRAVAQSANDAIVTADTAGNIVSWNPSAERIFGYTETEIMGQALTLLMPHLYHDRHFTDMKQALSSVESRLVGATVELTGRRKDKSEFPVDLSLAKWETPKGQFVTGIIRDITARKRAEKEILRYVEQLKTAVVSTVEVATIISEMRDPYTAGHERRVAAIAVAIGAELGFDANRRAGLRIAGQLHDIGKIAIPSEILTKPDKLSTAEFQLVQGHPQASYDVLKPIQWSWPMAEEILAEPDKISTAEVHIVQGYPQASYEVLKAVDWSWPVAEVALQHHERMDGTGYPQGLKGEAILLEARIMAVADVVEAMSSQRSYRPGLGIDKALAEIERGRGTAYDTDVVDACLRLFREKHYQLPA